MSRLLPLLAALSLLAASGCGESSSSTSASIPGTPTADGRGPSLEKPAADPQHPEVVIETTLGSVTLRLSADMSPTTVTNFLRYAQDGQYNGTIVHQVFKGQGFLAGGYGANLVERPTRTPIRNEARNGLKNRRGSVSMARLPYAVDSATSQFFVNISDNPALDYRDETPEGYGYCVFGEVIHGLDVIDRIAATPVHDTSDFERTPVEQIVIKSIRQTR